MSNRAQWVWAALVALLSTGCGTGATARLAPIPAQSVRVNSTLRVPIVVSGATAATSFAYEGPELPSLNTTVSISGTAAGGELRWTPLGEPYRHA